MVGDGRPEEGGVGGGAGRGCRGGIFPWRVLCSVAATDCVDTRLAAWETTESALVICEL
jgi:hypothetical protein